MEVYAEKFITEERKVELDLDFPNYEGEERNEVMIPYNRLTFAECPSMDIDEAIKILQKIKKKGANRVYFGEHQDHKGYYFYGTELKKL